MTHFVTTYRLKGLLALMLTAGLLTGCADALVSNEADPQERLAETADGKLRHPHLLDRAVRAPAMPIDRKGGGQELHSGDNLFLIAAVDENTSTLEKQKVLERFKVLERYKVLERHSYEEVFNGWALQIEDQWGLSDFSAFFTEMMLDPDILWYEPDFDIATVPSSPTAGSSQQEVPWNVAIIGGQSSWAVSGDGQGNVNVDLYVLDTGVAKAINSDPYDDFRLVDNIDFRPGMNDAADYDGHGTHVAGTAAAADDNDGLVGVAPGARVHNLKVLDDDGKTDVSVVIAAVEHILEQKLANPNKPMVVNMSLGEDIGTTTYTALDEAIAAATEAGVVFVVAAGNAGKDASGFTPAHVDGAITVGAYDPQLRFSSFSNWGPKVDLLAPGEDVVSLSPQGAGHAVLMDGTSMAAAHVSGAALLYLAQHPNATPAQVEQALKAKAIPFIADVPGNTTNKTVWVSENNITLLRVDEGNDDAEEFVNDGNEMYLTSSDLELAFQGGEEQLIGVRFSDTGIPQGATITSAVIQFTTDEVSTGTANLTIWGEDANDPAKFNNVNGNISSRPKTTASVAWAPPEWTTVGEAGAGQRTPDLAPLVQEMVDRPGWAADDMVFIIGGTGRRTAESFNGSASKAPLLLVEWHH